jgi:hypothetical protein
MTLEWSLPERHLMAELAVGIARRLNDILGPAGEGDHVGPGYVHHLGSSAFEYGCSVLWRLGLAYGAYGPEPDRKDLTVQTIADAKRQPYYFRFLSPHEIRRALLENPIDPSVPIDWVLTGYLGVACDYKPPTLPSERIPFVPALEYLREIDALANLGFVDHVPPQASWTDKVSIAMQSAFLWNADGQSTVTIARNGLREECDAVLNSMPEFTKRRLAQEAKRLSELDFVMLLRDNYDGLYFKKNPDGTPRERSGNVELLKAIYRALRMR